MVRGYSFISFLAVTIPLGFFKTAPLDELILKSNLDELPKESSVEHIVKIANYLDQYIEGVIQLKDDKTIEYLIEPETYYETPADDSILVVDASIKGNKSSIQEARFSKGNLTKNIVESIFDSAKNLTQVMKFAAEDLVLPEFQNYMDNLTQAIDIIYQNIGAWMKEEEKDLVYEIQTQMVKSNNELYFLRQTLTILAKETIDRSNSIIRLFKKLKQDDQEYNKKILEYNAKKMKKLLVRSFSILKDAIKTYLKVVEDIKLVKQTIKNLIFEIGSLDNEENERLQDWIKNRRLEAYGGAAACVIAPITCAATMPIAWKVSEDKIAKQKAKFNKLANATKKAENDTNSLLDKMDEKSKYVEKELTLIQKWSSHVSMGQDDLDPEVISDLIEFEGDKEAIESLCELMNACKDFIDHHLPGLENLEIDAPPLDEACLGEGVVQPTVKCKPHNTNGKPVNFYKIVRGQDPNYDCIVELDTNPSEAKHLRPANH